MQCNLEAFTQILVNSRNRIAHVKSKQKETYLQRRSEFDISNENVFVLSYHSISTFEIPEGLYKQKLTLRVQAINDHKSHKSF